MYLHTYLASFCDTSYSAIYELYLGLEVKKKIKKKLTSQCKNQIHIRFVSTQKWPSSDSKVSDCEFCCSLYHPKTDLYLL